MQVAITKHRLLAAAAALIFCAGAQAADPDAPVTEKIPVTDTYHQVQVTDPYRWLENGDDAKVRAWSEAQDARARKYLDGLPQRAVIHDRLYALIAATSSSYQGLQVAGDRVFAYYTQPPKQQTMIALLGLDLAPSGARVIVDPNAIDTKGTTAIDWFVASPDGKWLAVSMSENGSEVGSLHLFEVSSGKQVGAVIPHVQYPTGGGSVAWRADAKAFWYTRYPGAERPAEEQRFFQQVYFHKLGDDPERDSYVLGKQFPKVAEVALSTHFNPNIVLASVANGDGGEFEHYLIDAHGVRQISRFEDKIVSASVGQDGAVYLQSRKDAPHGKLLRLEPGVIDLGRAKILIPESDAVMQTGDQFGGEPIVITAHALYIRELIGGPSRVAIYDHAGASLGALPLTDPATVNEVEPLGDGTVVYSVATYLQPPYFLRYSEKPASSVPTPLAQSSPISFADTEVVRESAKSKDGTLVPINIMRRKGTVLNGQNPVLLNGYGGYGVSETPRFLGAMVRTWLDAGGVYVIANLRGGGEYGESWHAQGALTHKQNVFDDFIAAAEHLIAENYTTRDKLAILGGSNGGLLMGAVMTQRPELFHAVVSLVGIYDMLRVELGSNGSFNVTEFGTVKDPDQFKAMYAYSPYHHVKDGAKYPAVFMQTGVTDGRVDPMHSRKMIARLQAATASGKPVYLSINSHAGHGIGSALSIRVNQQADMLSFLFDQMNMKLPPR
jgi:prolyl oligopeptidase